MKKFKLINNITGWIIFIVASAVYLLTMEPTASFWDCGEFIATALKLQVGHPPGAPLFMMLGNFFIQFAMGNTAKMAVMMNSMSAILSGATILFLFWSITHLTRKLMGKTEELSLAQTIIVIGSGLVGALAYTFSDSFWFSAVEAEVYATSSFFTAIVFWAILKWEEVADEKYANRWLILIAYLTGLSIGVHLLNLLAIPAIVLVYYFKKYKVSAKGLFLALLLSLVILGFMLYGFIIGLVTVSTWFELLFVNGFGLPYNSGAIFFVVAIFALTAFVIYIASKKGKVILHTAATMFLVLLIGYTSYGMIIIRSNASTPMNENDPSNVFSLLSYLNREQYGDNPLVSGPYYTAYQAQIETIEKRKIYTPINGRYEATSNRVEYKFDDQLTTVFPRMYDPSQRSAEGYKNWANIKGRKVHTSDQQGKPVVVTKPTFGENLRFFFRYQIGWMYMRYFMWNFAGRQDDVQGHGDGFTGDRGPGSILHGNWLSGIGFIDNARLGPQDKLPASMTSNRARNKYYMLPFLLGVIGLVYHFSKGKKDAWVVLSLFILTGLAIVVYLNQKPFEPRERDYAYVGSFYAFAIWIGLGIAALSDWLGRVAPKSLAAALVTLICLLAVPGIMARENWDDHDRSKRYTARDFAYNYLNSCEKNAVVFTNGDNDTFPLWYIQEVEGVRTDVRVCNLSYLGADWYIRQMERKAYLSEPMKFSMGFDKYIQGKRDQIYLVDQTPDAASLKSAMQFLASDNPETKNPMGPDQWIDYIPTKKFYIPVDKKLVLENGTVTPAFKDSIVDTLKFNLTRNSLSKSDMMMLDFIAQNDWKRPVYVAITVPEDNYLQLSDYFRLDGLTYRLVPIKHKSTRGDMGSIDSKLLYENLMNKFRWGNMQDPHVYLDENNLRMLSNFRNSFFRLAETLFNEGKPDMAVKVLDRCMSLMSDDRVPFDYNILPIADLYFRIGQVDKGLKILETLSGKMYNELNYFVSIPRRFQKDVLAELDYRAYVLQRSMMIASYYKQTKLSDKISKQFEELTKKNPAAFQRMQAE